MKQEYSIKLADKDKRTFFEQLKTFKVKHGPIIKKQDDVYNIDIIGKGNDTFFDLFAGEWVVEKIVPKIIPKEVPNEIERQKEISRKMGTLNDWQRKRDEKENIIRKKFPNYVNVELSDYTFPGFLANVSKHFGFKDGVCEYQFEEDGFGFWCDVSDNEECSGHYGIWTTIFTSGSGCGGADYYDFCFQSDADKIQFILQFVN